MSNTQKFLAFSCLHNPLHDKEALEWLYAQIEDFKPDWLISLGDDFEAQAASRFKKIYPWSLSDEFRNFDRIFGRLRTLARRVNADCQLVKLWGNHGDNIQRMDRLDPDIRGLCNPYDHCSELKKWQTPVRYVADKKIGCFRLGQVTFTHGYEHGVSSDEMQSLKYGIPYGLFVSGHTHRPVPVRRATRTKRVPLPYWYANPGCLRTLCPEYARTFDHSQWGQGAVIGDFDSWRYSESLMPTKPLWNAETLIYRMAEGYMPDQPDWRK